MDRIASAAGDITITNPSFSFVGGNEGGDNPSSYDVAYAFRDAQGNITPPGDVTSSLGGNLFFDGTQALYIRGTIENASYTSETDKGSFIKGVMDLSNASAITINELRTAFAIQRLLERDARSGTRYREVLRAHFGVTVPDSRAMIPEYLGGKRLPINIQQVLQTSETASSGTPQGNTAAYSHTSDRDSVFTYSATEPGYIIGVAAIRYDHSYQQGIERFWTRRRRFDFYYPALANIGETPVYRREIYAVADPASNGAVFGYQEAWADYRYKPDRISGEFRSTYEKSLDVWHLGDEYDGYPTLSAGWIAETPANIDRTLTVPSTTASQFLCDFAFKDIAVRPMPIYSVPGLIDHN